jgi:hypothetical protein
MTSVLCHKVILNRTVKVTLNKIELLIYFFTKNKTMTIKEFLIKKGVLEKFKENVKLIVPKQFQDNIIELRINEEGHRLEQCFPFINTKEGDGYWKNLRNEFDSINNTKSKSFDELIIELRQTSDDEIMEMKTLTETSLKTMRGTINESYIVQTYNALVKEIKLRELRNDIWINKIYHFNTYLNPNTRNWETRNGSVTINYNIVELKDTNATYTYILITEGTRLINEVIENEGFIRGKGCDMMLQSNMFLRFGFRAFFMDSDPETVYIDIIMPGSKVMTFICEEWEEIY